jgi:phosphate transport system ATP-binding protein
MQQASRVSDYTAFFSTDESRLVHGMEFGNDSSRLATAATHPRHCDYGEGRFFVNVLTISGFNDAR